MILYNIGHLKSQARKKFDFMMNKPYIIQLNRMIVCFNKVIFKFKVILIDLIAVKIVVEEFSLVLYFDSKFFILGH